jgi:uncharacterized protein (DUF58 family)
MSISGILGNHNLNGLTVQIMPPEEVYDGLETLFTFRIHNGRRLLHSFLLEIVFQDHCSNDIPLLVLGETSKVTFPVTFRGRGEHIDHLVTIRSNFPINFFIRSRTIQLHQPILVFPRPFPCRSALSEYSDKAGQMNESTQKGYEGDVTRIGDYQGGEPLKMIHWKLSARHDSLKIKELSSTVAEPVEIDLHTLPGKSMESQICCASFLINEFSRTNRPVGLKLGKTLHPAATGRQHKYHLLSELARYGQD